MVTTSNDGLPYGWMCSLNSRWRGVMERAVPSQDNFRSITPGSDAFWGIFRTNSCFHMDGLSNEAGISAPRSSFTLATYCFTSPPGEVQT